MAYTYTQSFETPMERDRRRLEALEKEEAHVEKYAVLNDAFRIGTGVLNAVSLFATGAYAQYMSLNMEFHDNAASMLDAASQSVAMVANGLTLLYAGYRLIALTVTAPSARQERRRLDLARYSLSLENPDIFDGLPVCRNPATPDIYHGRHGHFKDYPKQP